MNRDNRPSSLVVVPEAAKTWNIVSWPADNCDENDTHLQEWAKLTFWRNPLRWIKVRILEYLILGP